MKPLTSNRVIDHSCAANNNIPNVGTDQVMSLSTLLIITVLFNYSLYPVYPSSWSSLEPSLNYEMNNFEHDLRTALMIMAINTGLARFNGVSDLYKEDRVTVDIHDVPTKSIINNLIKEIETNFSPSTRGDIFENYRSQIDSSDLIGCAYIIMVVWCIFDCGTRAFLKFCLSPISEVNSLSIYEIHLHNFKQP